MENKQLQSQSKILVSSIDLPDEIIIEILSRLPVMDLHRFKCVCKHWMFLITKGKLTLSVSGRNRVIAACCPQYRMRSDLNPIRFYSVENDVSIVKLPEPIGEIPSSFGDFEFLGTSKGLILFNAKNSMYLWNSSTGCCKLLSQLSVLISRFKSYIHNMGFGLWFDNRSNDYKVFFVDRETFYVGSLSKKENWMGISFPYDWKYFGSGSRLENIGVLLNGHLHWIVNIKPGDEQLIVYFEETESRFKELPMPKHDDDIRLLYSGLSTLDGCLCMSRSHGRYTHDHDNDVLIMREYGIWSTMFTIRGHLVPLQTTPYSNIVMVWTYPFMNTYNLGKRYLRKIKGKQSNGHTNKNYSFRNNVRIQIFPEPSVLTIDKGILMYIESWESVEIGSSQIS